MSVKRVYVEKKPEFAVKAGELREEISSYLSIDTVTGVRVLIRYDIENLSAESALWSNWPGRYSTENTVSPSCFGKSSSYT